ncbi:J domain-containing protein [Forsythia ovata]|uniref:J domain-containing protein n=1 Tax=Forsythia ovata TaxID=205694 RepID=A0ABD1U884_9LAMI
MGGCVSKSKQKVKSNAKYFYKSCKFSRKIVPAVPVAPVEHLTHVENYAIAFSVQELASLDIQSSETTICCMSKLQILTFQRSKLQQNHNELGTNDMDGEDHYAVLGLPSGEEGAKLSEKEITKAYRLKALELHPDKRPDDPNAHSNFQKLTTSYAILKDEIARKLFDDLL